MWHTVGLSLGQVALISFSAPLQKLPPIRPGKAREGRGKPRAVLPEMVINLDHDKARKCWWHPRLWLADTSILDIQLNCRLQCHQLVGRLRPRFGVLQEDFLQQFAFCFFELRKDASSGRLRILRRASEGVQRLHGNKFSAVSGRVWFRWRQLIFGDGCGRLRRTLRFAAGPSHSVGPTVLCLSQHFESSAALSPQPSPLPTFSFGPPLHIGW